MIFWRLRAAKAARLFGWVLTYIFVKREDRTMTYTYQPRGVCSQRMTVELDHGIIRDVRVEGGCNGNLQGISRLVIGMPATEAIEKMKGIRCGGKPSSCPDQLSIALEQALAREN